MQDQEIKKIVYEWLISWADSGQAADEIKSGHDPRCESLEALCKRMYERGKHEAAVVGAEPIEAVTERDSLDKMIVQAQVHTSTQAIEEYSYLSVVDIGVGGVQIVSETELSLGPATIIFERWPDGTVMELPFSIQCDIRYSRRDAAGYRSGFRFVFAHQGQQITVEKFIHDLFMRL